MANCCKSLLEHWTRKNTEECFSFSHSAKENKSSFSFNKNRKDICRIKLDGCVVVDSTTQRCDYILVDCVAKELYLVELKGKNIAKACEQLTSTFQQLPQALKNNYQIHAYIVATRVPKINSSVRRKQKQAKSLGFDIKWKTKHFEV